MSTPNSKLFSSNDPVITAELADYAQTKIGGTRNGKGGTFYPRPQQTWTESIPGTYYNQITNLTLASFFGSSIQQQVQLPGGLFDGVINHLALALDIVVATAQLIFAPTIFWMSKYTMNQSQGDQSNITVIYPHVKLLWLMSCIPVHQIAGYLEQLGMNGNTTNYLTVGGAYLPSTTPVRFYYYLDEAPINGLRLYNQTMAPNSLVFNFTTQSTIVAYNPSTTGTWSLAQLGWTITTKKLTDFDRGLIINEAQFSRKGRYFACARAIPLSAPITVAGSGSVINTLTIKVQNQGGRIFGYGITFTQPGVSNANNGFMTGCIHPGDNATYDVQLGTTTQINWGIMSPVRYLQKEIFNNHQSKSDLLTKYFFTLFIPLTNSLAAAFQGTPRGFRWTRTTDEYNVVLNPTALVIEQQTITKPAFAFTAGSWMYQDPITGELSGPVFFNSTAGGGSAPVWNTNPVQGTGTHDTTLAALPRFQANGMQVWFSDAFNDASTTITIYITSFLTNGVGGPIKIVPNGIVCNSLAFVPTCVIATQGRRGLAPNMTLNTTIFALYARKVVYKGKILFAKDVGEPEYEGAERAAKDIVDSAALAALA